MSRPNLAWDLQSCIGSSRIQLSRSMLRVGYTSLKSMKREPTWLGCTTTWGCRVALLLHTSKKTFEYNSNGNWKAKMLNWVVGKLKQTLEIPLCICDSLFTIWLFLFTIYHFYLELIFLQFPTIFYFHLNFSM